MKVHLYRSSRSTWCGLKTVQLVAHGGKVVRDHRETTCMTCAKANEAEQRRENAASA